MSYEFFIGLRYLRAKRKSTSISIITSITTAGVALGVLALIVVLAVMTGFEEDLKDKIFGTNAHVVVLKNSGDIDDYGPLAEPKTDAQVTNLSKSMVDGKLKDLEESFAVGVREKPLPGIVIGRELAKNLNLYLGDPVNIVSPMGSITPFGMVPKMKRFRVVGIFNTGMLEYDTTFVYTGIQEAQSLLSLGNTVTGIQLKVADVYQADKIARQINQKLGDSYYARDWMKMNKNILFALKTEKMVMFIILTLIVLVAAFGIASTLFMVVMEKHKDIAILKSMGATNQSIMKIFVLEGLIIGTTGTVIGVLGGVLVASNLGPIVDFIKRVTGFELFDRSVYYLDHFPSQVVPSDVLLISLTTIVISFVATLYPSWQGSRLPPAEALRYE
jgi:lipoprotein-releasing system permease protein